MSEKMNVSVTSYRVSRIYFFIIVLGLLPQFILGQSIVINEISQGASGAKEYVELLVTGPVLTACDEEPVCLDLRNWIIDDNNGYLNGIATSGVGIAAGACRFSNDPFWECIPAGTSIVIYNDSDVNPDIPADDSDLLDGNCSIVLPISSSLFERHTSAPSSSSMTYAATGWVSGGSWTNISMANSEDGFQIYNPADLSTPVFSIGWGPANSLGDIYMGSSSASGDVFYASDCDFSSGLSWETGSATSDQSPGALNTTGQLDCVGMMNHNCAPVSLSVIANNETCDGACDGTITVTVTGGTAPYDFIWSPSPAVGMGTGVISGLCDTTYTLTFIDNGGSGCEQIETIVIGAGPICCTDSYASEDVAVCEGTVYNYPDGSTETIFTATTNTTIITNAAGCDSIITTNIAVIPSFSMTEAVVVCPDEIYTFPDGSSAVVSTPLTHVSTLTGINGCDSIITTNISLLPAFSLTESIEVCASSLYTFPDGTSMIITEDVSYTSSLTSVSGCDSSITSIITVIPTESTFETIEACAGQTVVFPDGTSQIVDVAISHTSTLTSVGGCDSIVITNVSVITEFSSEENIEICEGNAVIYPDGTSETITSNTVHLSTLISIGGCDSIITTNVSMLPILSSSQSLSLCFGELFTFPDGVSQTITGDMSHVSILSSVSGCDSVVTTHVTVLSPSAIEESVVLCEGESYIFPDGVTEIITENTVHNSVLTGYLGCDSIITTTILVNSVSTTFETVDACIGDVVFLPDGNGVSVAGNSTYTTTLTSANGCDSIINTMISIDNQPQAIFIPSSSELTLENSEVTFNNYSLNATSYYWSFGDGTMDATTAEPTHEYETINPGSFEVTLIVINDSGCSDTAKTTLQIQQELLFFIPNVFTPDGDSYNEVFKPIFTSGFDAYDYHLTIFNRWGEIVFESYDASFGWDGTYGNQGLVQDGVYVWQIDFKESFSDKRHQEVGHVTVLR